MNTEGRQHQREDMHIVRDVHVLGVVLNKPCLCVVLGFSCRFRVYSQSLAPVLLQRIGAWVTTRSWDGTDARIMDTISIL
jgi:hypothetical protein